MKPMNEELPSKDLSHNMRDHVASAVKAAIGAIPFAGSLLSEIAGIVIPNQQLIGL
jgi:hypothetical protein